MGKKHEVGVSPCEIPGCPVGAENCAKLGVDCRAYRKYVSNNTGDSPDVLAVRGLEIRDLDSDERVHKG